MNKVLMIFGGIVLLGFIILVGYASAQRQEWLTAHCTQFGEMSGSTGVGPSVGKSGGVSVVYIPGKTGYRCDDGKEYWE